MHQTNLLLDQDPNTLLPVLFNFLGLVAQLALRLLPSGRTSGGCSARDHCHSSDGSVRELMVVIHQTFNMDGRGVDEVNGSLGGSEPGGTSTRSEGEKRVSESNSGCGKGCRGCSRFVQVTEE